MPLWNISEPGERNDLVSTDLAPGRVYACARGVETTSKIGSSAAAFQ